MSGSAGQAGATPNPIDDNWVDADGHKIYYECKVIEGDPGGEDGAYTRDGAKAMLARQQAVTPMRSPTRWTRSWSISATAARS